MRARPSTHKFCIDVSVIRIALISLYIIAASAVAKAATPNRTPRPCAWQKAQNRYVQLHVEYDSVLCSRYGGNPQSATPRIISAIRDSEQPFEEKTCIRFNVSSVTPHCDSATDPYGYLHLNGPKPSAYILSQFCDRWVASNSPPHFGVALFLTGFTSGDTAVGTAYIQGACSKSRPCAWVEGTQKETIAHELGHSFNAPHTGGPDLMAARLTQNTQFYFAPSSVNTITSFADSKRCGFRTDGSDAQKNGAGDGGFGDDGIGIDISFFNNRFFIAAGVVIAVVIIFTTLNWAIRATKRRVDGARTQSANPLIIV